MAKIVLLLLTFRIFLLKTPGMKTLTFKTEEEAFLDEVSRVVPGPSRHRIARAFWRMRARQYLKDAVTLDDEFAAMDHEARLAKDRAAGGLP